jgi:RNA polymerase primary sigma factor
LRQRTLLAAAQHGDRDALDRLVGDHLDLVRAVAARYRGCGLDFDDLVQEGSIGLLDAIERYDTGRGVPFEAYARLRIQGAIRNALTSQSRLIRLPKQIVERRRALDRVASQLMQAGLHPTPADLAAATGLSVQAVLEASAVAEAPLSLDEPAARSEATLESFVADTAAADPPAHLLRREQRALLESAIGRLKPRERRLVEERWGVNGSSGTAVAEVARELHVSPRRAQTIGRDALARLRADLRRSAAPSA